MLYLEDYLEMIEHLPQELRDRFTEMRELDLSVHNGVDSLEKKTRMLLLQGKRGELSDEDILEEHEKLQKDYIKIMEDAEEKVLIATQVHELVERYMKRLDSDLFKFKCELEADNNGITEILEKRSLQMDGNTSIATAVSNNASNQKDNSICGLNSTLGTSNSGLLNSVGAALGIGVTMPSTPVGATTKENRHRSHRPEKKKESAAVALQNVVPEKRASLSNNLSPGAPPVAVVRPITPGINAMLSSSSTPLGVSSGVTYNLQLGNSATTAIAAAASQAIVATQQMPQGRRTASLKASYEAIHGAAGSPADLWMNREATTPTTATTEKSKKKKLNASVSSAVMANSNPILANLVPATASVSLDSLGGSLSTTGSTTSSNPDGVTLMSSSSNNAVAIGAPSVTTTICGAGSAGLGRGGGGVALTVPPVNTNPTINSSPSATSTALTPGSNITLNENGMVVEQTADGEWSYDPNEPRYCTCNQVSYGDMVACDNDACPYEWFHYPCVGITQPPKGKWYCPKCTASMRRRGNRKN